MAARTENGTEVVAVGTNVEAFGAVDAKADSGKGDFEDLVLIDANAAGRAIDGFALAREFVEGNAVFFDGGDHGRDLIKLAGELLKSGGDSGGIDGRDGFGFKNFAGGILGVGGFAQFECTLVDFVLGHEKVLHAGSAADDEHEETGGNGVERATVADFTLVKAATDEIDDIVGGTTRGFVDQEEAVELGNHKSGMASASRGGKGRIHAIGLEPTIRERWRRGGRMQGWVLAG